MSDEELRVSDEKLQNGGTLSPTLVDPLSPESDTASMRTCASSFETLTPNKGDVSGSSTGEMMTAASKTLQDASSVSSRLKTASAGETPHADGSSSQEYKPEQMEFFDSPRMLKLAAQEGRVPFIVRTSSSGSSLHSDEEVDKEANGNHVINGVENGSDDEDTFTYKADVTPGLNDVRVTKQVTSERPSSLSVNHVSTKNKRKKISVAEDILNTADDVSSILDQTEEMFTAPLGDEDATENLGIPDDLETPDEIDDSIMEKLSELEFDEDRTPTPEDLRLELGFDVDEVLEQNERNAPEPIPTLTAIEEHEEARNWRQVVISGIERRIDMKAIEPYKKVISHGGYMEESSQAIIVFTACYLPDHSRRDYEYVMDNLFLYCLTTLDALIAEDYVLVYLHGATHRSRIPSFKWIRRCYQMIDRRLRKNLKGLFVVHPTFLVKTLVTLTRPFISTKFSRKLRFVGSLDELSKLVPMGQVVIPEKVRTYDEEYYAPDRHLRNRLVNDGETMIKPGIRLNNSNVFGFDGDETTGTSDC
ncbi:unnamed protein product [Notodromas monacha]|uniref:CRAL-TRIO domain-containing protein n=1 Tax=Notodromas monacha TaxID=399045 RepID=A0A7R9BEW8_9CRUS|nr:unnamed protein product [Notodromas monacha]CAG0914112.1 unnamed protein product [Notodromas monacha]